MNKYKSVNFQNIIKNLKTISTKYVNIISSKYKIDSNQLNTLLNNITFNKQNNTKDNIKTCQYEFKGKNEGKICKNKISAESKSKKFCGKHLSNKGKEKKVPAKVKKHQQQAEYELNVIKKLNDNKPTITIKRNKFGNYEHEETGLVMDRETKKIIGKQMPNNSILELTAEDIDTCKLWKFDYNLPSIITSKNNN